MHTIVIPVLCYSGYVVKNMTNFTQVEKVNVFSDCIYRCSVRMMYA